MSDYHSSSGNDSESDEGFASSDDNSDHGTENTPMMSIFANYYGIEDPSSNNENIAIVNGTIDDSKFNVDPYVKSMLLNESVENIVMRDAEMIHEIRTLDGEMQKLVYDNYNKFITATETIKEMKDDVFGMDYDMKCVREKMVGIVKLSENLDTVFDSKRSQVDKIVRIRRLLERLEFLSELPERLSDMIENELYIDAVKLYNKTISVLTRHSHVLSFKKIKERTEFMMQELTEKVIKLLDDSSLEINKLTQHVSVLRLMNAPRYRVFCKFISAHKQRSSALIEQFNEEINCEAVDSHSAVSKARTFHQSYIAGLLEMCKGINELYTKDASSSGVLLKSFTLTGPMHMENEFLLVFEEVATTVNDLMVNYTDKLLRAFKSFCKKYGKYYESNSIIDFELDYDFIEEQNPTENFKLLMSKIRFLHGTVFQDVNGHQSVTKFSLEEEQNLWLLLIRQSVLDVVYLDKSRIECIQKLGVVEPAVMALVLRDNSSFRKKFCKQLLNDMIDHYKCMRNACIENFVDNICSKWVHILHYIISSKESVWDKFYSENNFTDNIDHRTIFQQHIYFMKDVYGILLDECVQSMSESLKFLKPVFELYEIVESRSGDFQRLCNSWLIETVDEIILRVSKCCNVFLSTSQKCFHEASCEVYLDQPMWQEEKTCKTLRERQADGLKSLVCAALFRNFSNNLFGLVYERIIKDNEFVEIPEFHEIEIHLVTKLDTAFQQFITKFVEENSYCFSGVVLKDLSRFYYHNCSEILISNDMIEVMSTIDYFARLCYLLFMEIPPIIKMSSTLPSEVLRRSSTVNIRQSIVGSGNSNNITSLSLQLDIDRLFTQRVKVFEDANPSCGTEYILTTFIKAILRAVHEETRPFSLNTVQYNNLKCNVTFIKQSSSCILKDMSNVENLSEQLLATCFNRYIEANDINAAEGSELGIQKIINDAFFDVSTTSILIGRGR